MLGTFNKTTGEYPVMGLADYFISLVMSGTTEVAKLSGKVWPVGEPMAVKSVVGDMKTKEGKPNNCIINTAFLSADKNPTGVSGYLDTANPVPVICSSDFQSHKRFKIPMQPASLDPANTPIDLVFNVVDEANALTPNPPGLPGNTATNPLNLRPYQVFSKINNYTGKRLAGYKVVVGIGTGSAFQSASEAGIADRLHISLGVGEGYSDGATPVPDGSNLLDDDGGLASFSHGLFGPIDKHFPALASLTRGAPVSTSRRNARRRRARTRRVRPTTRTRYYRELRLTMLSRHHLFDDCLAEQLQRPGRAGGNAGVPVGRLVAVRLGAEGNLLGFR